MIGKKVDGQILIGARSEKSKIVFGARGQKRKNLFGAKWHLRKIVFGSQTVKKSLESSSLSKSSLVFGDN